MHLWLILPGSICVARDTRTAYAEYFTSTADHSQYVSWNCQLDWHRFVPRLTRVEMLLGPQQEVHHNTDSQDYGYER